jgi:prepilin-type N-terminal cleavage/methylation domain-containing protein
MSRSQTVSKQASRGFTLIELMVVIAIISVLAAISIPVFSRTRENARQTRCTANLHAIAVALRSYMTDWNGFPLPYDPVVGTGGITQLYLEGYLTSNRVLRCPDDPTALADYRAANSLTDGTTYPQWDNTDKNDPAKTKAAEALFADRYSSYNQLLASNAAYPIYNYYGYRGAGSDYRSGALPITVNVSGGGTYAIQPTPVATGPSDAEINSLVGNGLLGSGGFIWAKAIYTDANHLYSYDDGTGVRVFDRDMASIYNRDYARPLWDVSMNNTTSYFPGLVNRNAPDNTIVTHCTFHRSWFGNSAATQQDLIVRLGGDTEKQKLSGYDWVIQKQSTTE